MVVLVFAVLLTGSIATFQRRAAVDTMIARNRESRAQAEALALGGIELAKALRADGRTDESRKAAQRALQLNPDPGQVADLVKLLGDEAEVRAGLRRLEEAGVTDLCLFPYDAEPGSGARTLALLGDLARS